ncbi:amidohydrolase family protein [Chloroflexota bacterium]
MPVIDFRFRPPTEELKQSLRALTGGGLATAQTGGVIPPWSTVIESWWDATLEDCVKEMEKIDLIGVVAGRGPARGLGVSNDHIKDIVDKYPERFIGIAGISPSAGERRQCQDEIERIAKMGLKGVHFDPGFLEPSMVADDPRLYPIYAQCEDLGLIVNLQIGPRAGLDVEQMSPTHIDKASRDFPNLQMAISHAAWPLIEEMVAVIWKRPNVWLSPDNYQFRPLSKLYVDAVNYISPLRERYLYGSAYPFGRGVKAQLDEWRKLPWDEAIVEQLLYGNAARLFKIK